MYTSSRRNSTGTQLGESDKDRKMRLVGDSNRRASRQLAKQLTHIDKHLQVNLKQINGDADMKASSVSPPLPMCSPRYLASSSDSLEGSSHSSSLGQKLTYRVADQCVPGHGDQRMVDRKPKSQPSTHQSETEGRETEGKLIQPREKTFTIIDHGLASEDVDSVTGDNLNTESKARGRTLDALDNTRLVQGGGEKPARINSRNDMASNSHSRKQAFRGDHSRDENGKPIRNYGRNRESDLYKVPGQKMISRGQILGTISSNPTGETLEYSKEDFDLNEGGLASQPRHSVPRGKHSSAKNKGQMHAKDELNRRQLRKMHILSNLNKKHMKRDPSNDNMDVFVSRDHDARVSRTYGHVQVPGADLNSQNSRVEPEKPRPKSALFSSHRRPRFTSDDDDDVFLDDLDIIDINDDGESSDDDDNLNSSFVAPLKSTSRHPLGLHTRSTSDISPSNFCQREENHFRVARTRPRVNDKNSLKNGEGRKNSSEDNLASNTLAIPENENLSNRRSSGDGGVVEKEKYVGDNFIQNTTMPAINSKGDISPKSETEKTNKETNDIAVSSKVGLEGARPVPVFPRKLKPLFKPDHVLGTGEISPTLGDNATSTETGTPTSPKSDSQLSPKLLQRASSHVYHNKKLSRSRQKTWTAGVGVTGARDLLKRPLPPTSTGTKPRAKSNFSDVTRPIPRRRARTSSELKKCSTKELQTLKSGEIPDADTREVASIEKEFRPLDLTDGLRNCRYLRTTSDPDSLSSAVNVETC